MDDTRETAVFLATMAERAERYDDMLDAMKIVAKMNVELTAEERALLSLGFKHVLVARRASWRILSSMEKEEESQVNVGRIQVYIKQVEAEIIDICVAAKSILVNHAIPSCTSPEGLVFYYKMIGDYYRYCAEFKTGDDKKLHASESLAIYEKGTKIAEQELSRANPTRLNLALNLSVFYWEILVIPQRACDIAKAALDGGYSELDTLNKESQKASLEVMQLLRDNLILWRHEMSEKSAGNNDGDGGGGGGAGAGTSAAKNDGGEGSSSAAKRRRGGQ